MASAQINMTCAICTEVFTSPRFLPCHHTFCLECLEQLANRYGNTIPCPTCRTPFVVPPGGVCDLQVNFYFTDEALEQARSDENHSKCPVHTKERVLFYCAQCDQAICMRCKLTKHDGHVTEDLSETASRCQQTIKQEMHRLEEAIAFLTNNVLECLKENEKRAREKRNGISKQPLFRAVTVDVSLFFTPVLQDTIMAASDMASAQINMTCAICREVFTSPRFLPCHHTFCLECLEQLANVHGNTIPCPTCRARATVPPGGVRALQVNFYFTDEALEQARSDETHLKCPVHTKEHVLFYCAQCDQAICLRCKLTKHDGHVTEDLSEAASRSKQTIKQELHRLEDSIDHVTNKLECLKGNEKRAREKRNGISKQVAPATVPPGGVRALQVNFYFTEEALEQARNEGSHSMCNVHTKECVIFYCTQCDQAICMRCKLTKHEGHVTEDLSEITARRKKKIEEELPRLKDSVERITRKCESFKQSEELARKKKAVVLKEVGKFSVQ
ncbi:hypothetical protein C0Q70_03433 [Pomacea canaliculata]|uniref:Uncharacterized protein n=1 Tax=Pomacea canaliculata TaxID=400727 RepID=A0A2T7PSQ4_POMCA|nr:hypothetical protein C0Q70_03433 [Pomacea canaliculata]